jgi:hypothetical protein
MRARILTAALFVLFAGSAAAAWQTSAARRGQPVPSLEPVDELEQLRAERRDLERNLPVRDVSAIAGAFADGGVIR